MSPTEDGPACREHRPRQHGLWFSSETLGGRRTDFRLPAPDRSSDTALRWYAAAGRPVARLREHDQARTRGSAPSSSRGPGSHATRADRTSGRAGVAMAAGHAAAAEASLDRHGAERRRCPSTESAARPVGLSLGMFWTGRSAALTWAEKDMPRREPMPQTLSLCSPSPGLGRRVPGALCRGAGREGTNGCREAGLQTAWMGPLPRAMKNPWLCSPAESRPCCCSAVSWAKRGLCRPRSTETCRGSQAVELSVVNRQKERPLALLHHAVKSQKAPAWPRMTPSMPCLMLVVVVVAGLERHAGSDGVG